MKFHTTTAITTILVLFSASCSAAPAGEFVDHSSVILKEVQHVYDEMEIFSDYFVGLDADEVTSDVLSELKEDLSNIMAPFKKVDREIDIQLGIPDDPSHPTDGKSEELEDVNKGGGKDIEEEEYES